MAFWPVFRTSTKKPASSFSRGGMQSIHIVWAHHTGKLRYHLWMALVLLPQALLAAAQWCSDAIKGPYQPPFEEDKSNTILFLLLFSVYLYSKCFNSTPDYYQVPILLSS
jgi:hypothetical protein